MRTLNLVFSICWSVLAVGAFVAFMVTGDNKFFALNMGALALSLLYQIAARLEERP